MPREPYRQAEALKYIKAAWRKGLFRLSRHAETRLAERDLTVIDVANVVRCGRVNNPAEFEKASYRYKVETDRIAAIFAFDGSEKQVALVTA